MPIPALLQDPFAPVLLSSPALNVTPEQIKYIKQVLDRACSDSRFSDKAFVAIARILSGGSVKVPTVTSVVPSSAVIGSPDFTLTVHGTNFTAGSKIYFNGGEEPTTFVNNTTLSTGVNMATVSVPSTVPVGVLSEDGVFSNPTNFSFTAPAVRVAEKTVVKETVVEKLVEKKPETQVSQFADKKELTEEDFKHPLESKIEKK